MNTFLKLNPLRLLIGSIIIVTQLSAAERATQIASSPDGTVNVTIRLWTVATGALTSSDNSTNTHRRSINDILAPLIRKVALAIPENVVYPSSDDRIQPHNELIIENVIGELFDSTNAEELSTLGILQGIFPAQYSKACIARYSTQQA